MTTLLLILWIMSLAALLIVLACRPTRTRHSWSELNRRGDKAVIRREHLLGDVLALRRVLAGLLLVCLVLLGLSLWHATGVLVAVVVWLLGGAIARWRPLHGFAMRLYEPREPQLLGLVERVPLLGKLFRDDRYIPHDQHLESVEHLLQLVDASAKVLSDDQRSIISHGIRWHTIPVEEVMTPVKKVISVKHTELLGPLVLDDLHRSGHVRFPVIRGDVDTIVGVLDITRLLEVSVATRSETAEKVMTADVPRIESDEPLPTALERLRESDRPMLAVVDRDGKTAGIVTLGDILGALLGKNRGEMVK